jgi:dTDP-glucose 4,6-dehydratase
MRLQDGRVVPAFISQALRNESLTIFGDGSQTRSFCYVSDLIDGFFRLAMSTEHGPINIGNPVEMTIQEFAERIIEIVGCTSGIEYRPLPVDDPKVRRPDITRARTLLGWEPKVPFDKGITRTIEYFRTVVLAFEIGVPDPGQRISLIARNIVSYFEHQDYHRVRRSPEIPNLLHRP